MFDRRGRAREIRSSYWDTSPTITPLSGPIVSPGTVAGLTTFDSRATATSKETGIGFPSIDP
jgi:hypothetical protein